MLAKVTSYLQTIAFLHVGMTSFCREVVYKLMYEYHQQIERGGGGGGMLDVARLQRATFTRELLL